jgi:hypothetical protein
MAHIVARKASLRQGPAEHFSGLCKYRQDLGRLDCPMNLERVMGSMERVTGIEPVYSAWKAAALPLSYTRLALIDRWTNGGESWI